MGRMGLANRLSAALAGFAVASLAFAVTPPIASADECASGYMSDPTGQCVPAPPQGQANGTAPSTDTAGGVPPNLQANTCGDGYGFDQAGSCVPTSPSTEAGESAGSSDVAPPGSAGKPGDAFDNPNNYYEFPPPGPADGPPEGYGGNFYCDGLTVC